MLSLLSDINPVYSKIKKVLVITVNKIKESAENEKVHS